MSGEELQVEVARLQKEVVALQALVEAQRLEIATLKGEKSAKLALVNDPKTLYRMTDEALALAPLLSVEKRLNLGEAVSEPEIEARIKYYADLIEQGKANLNDELLADWLEKQLVKRRITRARETNKS